MSDINQKYVIFDLDGTLIDSFECVLRCVNKALDYFSLPHVEILPSERVSDIAIIFNKAKKITEGRIDFINFKDRFDMIHFFDHTESVIVIHKCHMKLKYHYENGEKIVIITNKFQPIAEKICKHFFRLYNVKIFGRKKGFAFKNDPMKVVEVLQKNGFDLMNCICYYGDCKMDQLLSEIIKTKFINVSDL